MMRAPFTSATTVAQANLIYADVVGSLMNEVLNMDHEEFTLRQPEFKVEIDEATASLHQRIAELRAS